MARIVIVLLSFLFLKLHSYAKRAGGRDRWDPARRLKAKDGGSAAEHTGGGMACPPQKGGVAAKRRQPSPFMAGTRNYFT